MKKIQIKTIYLLLTLFALFLLSLTSIFANLELQKVDLGLKNITISELVSNPNNQGEFWVVVKSNSTEYTFKTVDSGNTWSKVNTPATPNRIVFQNKDKNIVAITTNDPKSSFAISKDNGKTWKSTSQEAFISPLNLVVRDQNETLRLKGVAIDPNDANIIYAGSVHHSSNVYAIRSHIFKSVDGGATWKESDSGILHGLTTMNSIVIDSSNSNNIYVTTNSIGSFQGEALYSSSDAGATWTRVGKKSIDRDVYDLVLVEDKILAATRGWVFKRKVSETLWQNVNFNIVNAFDLTKNNNTLYVASREGLYKTNFNLDVWEKQNISVNLSNDIVTNVEVDSGGTIMIALEKQGLYVSSAKETKTIVKEEQKVEEPKVEKVEEKKVTKKKEKSILQKIGDFFRSLFK